MAAPVQFSADSLIRAQAPEVVAEAEVAAEPDTSPLLELPSRPGRFVSPVAGEAVVVVVAVAAEARPRQSCKSGLRAANANATGHEY